MNHVVLIAFRGGGTVLPYRTPYDGEIVFEHVAQCAKRYGDVRIELGGHHWTVSATGGVGVACGVCGQAYATLYSTGSSVLCHLCARRQLITGGWNPPGAHPEPQRAAMALGGGRGTSPSWVRGGKSAPARAPKKAPTANQRSMPLRV